MEAQAHREPIASWATIGPVIITPSAAITVCIADPSAVAMIGAIAAPIMIAAVAPVLLATAISPIFPGLVAPIAPMIFPRSA